MSLSKLQASLAAVSNEITIAAARLNFDFSLVKIEAPKEYQALGQALTKHRKENAEMGAIHITARRLGALFEDICPSTPNLVKAYGTRASEIAEAAVDNSSSENAKSIFGGSIGIDGTAIWAAATSSTAALQVQLLACMLARAWTGPEAISIWVELVNERRQFIAAKMDENSGIHYSTATAAAQADISRPQLADWDASARSWLRTADKVKFRKQKQLMLVLDNIDMPVNKDGKMYSSVISAWTSALESIEKLISGEALAINHGAPLLGLSAWHIYPDMNVVQSEHPVVRQDDILVPPGAVLTLGLGQTEGSSHRGVYWSLSLSHYRCYGRPVHVNGGLNRSCSRITVEQLMLVALGAVLGAWGISGERKKLGAKVFIALEDLMNRPLKGFDVYANLGYLRNPSRWIRLLARTSRAYLDPAGDGEIHKLVSLGERRWENFIGERDHWSGWVAFGLLKHGRLLYSLSREGQIMYLRRVASEMPKSADLLIRCSIEDSEPLLVTAIPRPGGKRKRSGVPIERHIRWVPNHNIQVPEDERSILYDENALSYEALFDSFLITTEEGIKEYKLMLGNPHSQNACALFHHHTTESTSDPPLPLNPSIEDLLWCLQGNHINPGKLLGTFRVLDEQNISHTLQCLSFVEDVYKFLPDNDIDIRLIERPLRLTRWGSRVMTIDPLLRRLDVPRQRSNGFILAFTMACIAYLDSGTADIVLSSLNDVFAVSSGDSIFVDARLVCDPHDNPKFYEVTRILGNMGLPGVTALVPPAEPMVRETSPSTWRMINHFKFNGLPEDHFGRTSLHLSCTEYYKPIVDRTGTLDDEVSLQEAVVSVHDSGKWVADIDIIKALRNPAVEFMGEGDGSKHESCPKEAQEMEGIISVESWDELMEYPPKQALVIRSNGNIFARLAALSVVVQTSPGLADRAATVTICSPSPCWACIGKKVAERKKAEADGNLDFHRHIFIQ